MSYVAISGAKEGEGFNRYSRVNDEKKKKP